MAAGNCAIAVDDDRVHIVEFVGSCLFTDEHSDGVGRNDRIESRGSEADVKNISSQRQGSCLGPGMLVIGPAVCNLHGAEGC